MTRNFMKKVLVIVLCLLGTGLHAQTKTLKVISYNIWNGFDFRKDIERKNNVIDWFNDQKPDVVALQELCGYNEETLLDDAKKWGHNYVVILKDNCHSVGLTSVNPIIVKEKVLEGLLHGMLHCETFGIDFFVIHLSPKDRDFKVKESEIIISKIASINNIKIKLSLTGFKWIGKMINDYKDLKFLAGGEESFGYLIGDFVRDKDALTSSLLISEICSELKANGSSFYERMIDCYIKYGFFKEKLYTLKKEGKKGAQEIKNIITSLKSNPPEKLLNDNNKNE